MNLKWKRLLTIIVLIYIGLKVAGQFWFVVSNYIYHHQNSNPLIPDSLWKFITFEYAFIIPLWFFGLWMGWRFFRNSELMKKKFWILPLLIVGLFICEIGLRYGLPLINPWA